jgi:FdhD protein
MPDPRSVRRTITRLTGGRRELLEDAVAVERPLEIHVAGRPIAVTLRTPGHDRELALGFLAGEGLIRSRADVAGVTEHAADCADRPDRVEIALAPGVPFDWSRLERHFASTAACGLCGRAHLESLRAGLTPLPDGAPLDPGRIARLPEDLRAAQSTFLETGGLHAAALCAGETLTLQVIREDVGRHNAVDKVAGWLVGEGRYPTGSGVLWVSGRAGAEIVLKAARAGIPVMASVGAPSSLAIELAESAAMTLVGFLRSGRMNIYAGTQRIAPHSIAG